MFVIYFFIFTILILYSSVKIRLGNIYYLPLLIISTYSLVASLGTIGSINYNFAETWSNKGIEIFSNHIMIYSLILCFIYFLSIFLSEKIIGRASISGQKSFNFLKSKYLLKLSIIFSLFSVFYLFLYLIFIDINILWLNNTYLLASSNDALHTVNGFSIFLQKFSGLFTILCCIFFPLLLQADRKFFAFLVFIPLIFYILLRTGTHSRASFLYLIILSMMFFMSEKRMHKFLIAPILFLISFLNLVNSLVGRNNGEHGFYALFYYFDNILKAFKDGTIIQAIFNLFEGIFVLGDGFFFKDYQYPFVYKILSISPFPSFIDGFSEKAFHLELRLHTYVPMGALSELWIFGVEYLLYYFTIIFLSIFMLVRSLRKNHIYIFFIILILICLASVIQYTYPIRNVMRFYYISIFLGFFYMYLRRFRWGSKK